MLLFSRFFDSYIFYKKKKIQPNELIVVVVFSCYMYIFKSISQMRETRRKKILKV